MTHVREQTPVPAFTSNGHKTAGKLPGRRVFVMLGAPGAGKGTQADLLSAKLSLPHISSGEMFRTAQRTGTPVGLEASRYLERGALVPDELTIQLIGDRLAQPDAHDGVILDGFPRTRPQAEALDQMLAAQGTRVTGALYVEVDRDELVRRLSGRRVCTSPVQHNYHDVFARPRVPGICDIDGTPLVQRPDDRPETVLARMEKQLPPMYEVVDYYADKGVLCAVRGDLPIDKVTEELLHAVDTACQVR